MESLKETYSLVHSHGMKIKKIIIRSLGILLIASIGFLIYYGWRSFPIITAYGSKVMCSAIFDAGRNEQQVRDQDLCISGNMSTKMYGPGVMPWQPDGIWLSPYNGSRWQKSQGEEQYRRAVYTYWKRSSPYPSMMTFDGAQRVVCNARRIRTNTPLQALVTLNDSVYLDLARHFAARIRKEGGPSVSEQLTTGYQLLLYKKLPAEKMQVFMDLYNEALKEFQKDTVKAKEMIDDDTIKTDPSTAALVIVANAMLNLDEVVTKN